MLKKLLPILAAMLLLMCAPALAATTEEEWNASCSWVIAQDATLYTAALTDEVTTATDLYAFSPIGTIAAGSRVSVRSSAAGMREIYYWNGGKHSAWVQEGAVKWAGGTSSTGSSGAAKNSGRAAKSSGVWKDFPVAWAQEDGSEKKVSLETLGTMECEVFDGEQFLTVATASLSWETEADDKHRLAVICAPRTGKCTLRAKASSSAKSLGSVDAGRIVVVLQVGDKFSRIVADGKEGFVLTDVLSFCQAAPMGSYGQAVLIYQGRTDSSATISVYTAPDASRKIRQWRVGNQVMTGGERGAWTEIEIDGWHGFVKTEYLK